VGEAALVVAGERDENGPYADLSDLACRSGASRDQIAALIRAGACDVLERPRRAMLWELGTLARPVSTAAGRQLPLPLAPSPSPPLPEQGRFERVVADYEMTGMSTGWHLVTLVRPGLPAGTRTAAELRDAPDGARVTVAGLVVARQRPGTAHGIVFLLLEDETGMVNVIVRPEVYERHRALMRAEPLLVATGRLERRGRNLNVLATDIARAAVPVPAAETPADAHRLRAAAPAGQHFGRGRR
jgi:error-prone DNA polymerase